MAIKCVLFDLDNTLTDRRASITNFTRRFADHFKDELGDISFADLDTAMQRGDNLGYKPKPQMFADLANNLPWQTAPTTDTIRDF